MLKVAARALRDPIRAANAVAIACGAFAVALAWAAARRAFDAERAWWIAIAIAITPLLWRSSTAAGPFIHIIGCAIVPAGSQNTGLPHDRLGLAPDFRGHLVWIGLLQMRVEQLHR